MITPKRAGQTGCPRQDSNLRFRLRRAALYPLSYGGNEENTSTATYPGGGVDAGRLAFRTMPGLCGGDGTVRLWSQEE